MTFFIIIVGAIILALILFNVFKKRSMDKIFQLASDQVLVIDVRTKEEFDGGHFSTALNIPVDMIGNQIERLEPYRLKTIVLYCHSGNRSEVALNVLKQNGFTHVVNAGGYEAIRRYDTKK